MKTKEFIEKIQSIGYGAGVVPGSEEELCVVGNNENVVLLVHTEEMFGVNTDWHEFKRLDDEDKKELLDIAFEYIKTPIKEREEPKKYYLKLPNADAEVFAYLNLSDDKKYFFASSSESIAFQTQFTQKEIDNLPNQDFIKTLIKEEVE